MDAACSMKGCHGGGDDLAAFGPVAFPPARALSGLRGLGAGGRDRAVPVRALRRPGDADGAASGAGAELPGRGGSEDRSRHLDDGAHRAAAGRGAAGRAHLGRDAGAPGLAAGAAGGGRRGGHDPVRAGGRAAFRAQVALCAADRGRGRDLRGLGRDGDRGRPAPARALRTRPRLHGAVGDGAVHRGDGDLPDADGLAGP